MLIAKEHRLWLFGFILLNVIATLLMNYRLELLGDLNGTAINDISELWLALFLISFSYIIMMILFFSFFKKIKFKKVKFKQSNNVLGTRIGVVVCVLQILFFVFNSHFGVNTAGSNNTRADTPLAYLWVLVPADALFVIYYAFHRDNKLFKLNLAIWLISNLVRGWAGVFLFIIFFEWCRLHRKGAVGFGKVLLAFSIVLVLYPILSITKWVMRASGEESFQLKEVVANAMAYLVGQDYTQFILDGITHIIGRLQLTSVLTEIINIQSTLQIHYEAGDYLPFWMEGLHGIVIERLFYGDKTMYLSTAFTEYANFGWDFTVGDWNINVGLPAWLIITPYLSVFYLFYIFVLCFLSFFLMKLIGETEGSNDLIWFSWLIFLIPLWLGTFVAFIYAMFVFLTIKYILSIIPNFKLRD